MEISLREKHNVTILDLAGELIAPDCSGLPPQVKELLAAGKKKIALNLKKVERADSLGLGALAASFVSAQRQEGTLRLFSPNERVREAIRATRLDFVIATYSKEKDAVASFD